MPVLARIEDDVVDPVLKIEIDFMSHVEMARIWRFAPPGDRYLRGATGAYFAKRFEELGGMSYEVSTTIGWHK